MKLKELHAEVVKRDSRYFVIVRQEVRLFGLLLWAGEWKEDTQSTISRLEALKRATYIESMNKR